MKLTRRSWSEPHTSVRRRQVDRIPDRFPLLGGVGGMMVGLWALHDLPMAFRCRRGVLYVALFEGPGRERRR